MDNLIIRTCTSCNWSRQVAPNRQEFTCQNPCVNRERPEYLGTGRGVDTVFARMKTGVCSTEGKYYQPEIVTYGRLLSFRNHDIWTIVGVLLVLAIAVKCS